MNNKNQYSTHYSDSGFWNVVKGYGKKIKFLKDAIAMFYCLKDENTPAWVKGMIIGALGYFICPLDAIPDYVPLGFIDDAGVITGCLAVIRAYITEEHWQKADKILGGI